MLAQDLRKLLESQPTLNLVPMMSKILTVDSRLKLSEVICYLHRYRRAFACVYDSSTCSFVNTFDSKSVLSIYLSLAASARRKQNALEEDPSTNTSDDGGGGNWDINLSEWLHGDIKFPFSSSSSVPLIECLRMLVENNVPRVYIWNTQRATVFSYVTIPSIVAHIVGTSTLPNRSWSAKAVEELKLGVPSHKVIAVDENEAVTDAVRLLLSRGWSSVPVLREGTYVGLFSAVAFHKLVNKSMVDPTGSWSYTSSVGAVMRLLQQQGFAHPASRVHTYEANGPAQSSNVFMSRLASSEKGLANERCIPMQVNEEPSKDPCANFIKKVSISAAVLGDDLTMKQVFVHLSLTDDKRIVLIDSL